MYKERLSKLTKKEKILILRYANNIIPDCIQSHIDVLQKDGYCWFGKIGKIPSKKVIDEILEEKEGTIVLYARNKCYLCKFIKAQVDTPSESYPMYYNDKLFGNGIKPNCYFKLITIKSISLSELEEYFICSSHNRVIDALLKSMSSVFIAEKVSGDIDEYNIVRKKNEDEKLDLKSPFIEENDCVYRKDGKCTLINFVNYEYECDRPKSCIKQTR